mmetsp:Transcript_73366/g.122577  ORF Transcript_73366/g.122577 Transcript_73366/m.122577 type:complete len:374 (-) Transcript_73366:229-1350(-)|eukprot:CAMPEP_0119320372 /NCGR_PEP_ID=MMETSP1333-20130426/52244_1 /TAXON_ID=418940 /ORGANISM="Scyphosphaera apsteinii, Strain RCC1455" /LENGTH=373 /DNA_ID=CAMNT_0007327079 /DNA_START=54 /DNA_END=1175 /DNA_ORIENTATION=+
MLALAYATCCWFKPPHAHVLMPYSVFAPFPYRRSPLLACAFDMEATHEALQEAVAREDYAEAARLKKKIDTAKVQQESTEVRKADKQQAFLLDSAAIQKLLESGGKSAVVLHWTAPEHSISNGMVERIASIYSGSQLAGGTPVAFLRITTQGIERLGKSQLFTDPRKPAEGQSGISLGATPLTPLKPLPVGWREAQDPKTGRTYYIDVKNKKSTWTRPLTDADATAQKVFAERSITSLPTTQIWQHGKLVKEVSSMMLESTLAELGARPVTGSATSFAKGTERLRDRDRGSGLPSATAVDDIDFTGGKAGYGGTSFNTKFNDKGKTTRKFLPGLTDLPGDNMGKEGPPQRTFKSDDPFSNPFSNDSPDKQPPR